MTQDPPEQGAGHTQGQLEPGMIRIGAPQAVGDEPVKRTRKAVRYGVPAGIAALAAATIGLVPALAQDSAGLADLSAEELIAKVLDSDAQAVQGTVKFRADLGLPTLPGGLGGGTEAGADPRAAVMGLLSGEHTLRVAADGPERQKATLVGERGGDYTVLHNGDDVWAYGGGAKEVFHGTGADAARAGGKDGATALPEELADLSPREFAKQALAQVGESTSVSVEGTTSVAGQDAYLLRIAPKERASTVKDIRIAIAENGVPLRFTLTSDSDAKVVEAGFTQVSFAKPAADVFAYKPPAGTKVTEEKLGEHRKDGAGPEGLLGGFGKGAEGAKDVKIHGSDWTTVAELRLPDKAKSGKDGKDGKGEQDGEGGPAALLGALTTKADGGRLFSTNLVNVLVTDDDRMFVGAVDKAELERLAAG
ncbi:outer membrane lipoprotein carrier protein LolA [Streptomyces polyrhachis]|uniref:Outer membrane lipoprotein carrier protein LolA n=1 Tax=Streptomyces polyrhachis TaxID=1282885 RepID=A0ABW2GL97_9ACTN